MMRKLPQPDKRPVTTQCLNGRNISSGTGAPAAFSILGFLLLLCLGAAAHAADKDAGQTAPQGTAAEESAAPAGERPATPSQSGREGYRPPLSGLAADFSVQSNFRSHLPVLLLEMEADSEGDETRSGRLLVFDSPLGDNSPFDAPRLELSVTLSEQKAPLREGDKNIFSLALAETGPARGASLLGLPEAGNWTLHGSMRDKGMLRNGLAYALGRELLPQSTPEFRFCELVSRKEGALRYQGIFILAESMGTVFKRLDDASEKSIALLYSPDKDLTRVAASATDRGSALFGLALSDRGFETIYPESVEAAAARKQFIDGELEKLTQALGSTQPSTYLGYLALIDDESLIKTLLLNALLMNGENGPLGMYIFRRPGEKMQFLPLWRFEMALDNAPRRAAPLSFDTRDLDIEPPSFFVRRIPVWRALNDGAEFRRLPTNMLYQAIGGASFAWLERICLSRHFVQNLYASYHQYRLDRLSAKNMVDTVDAIAKTLGQALERDWARWNEAYSSLEPPFGLEPVQGKEGLHLSRVTASYDQELVKLRFTLRNQSRYVLEVCDMMQWFSMDLFNKAASGNQRAGWAIVMVVGFMVLSHIIWMYNRH